MGVLAEVAQTRWSDTDTGEHANVRTGKGGIALAGNLNFVFEAIIDKFTVRPEIFGESLGTNEPVQPRHGVC